MFAVPGNPESQRVSALLAMPEKPARYQLQTNKLLTKPRPTLNQPRPEPLHRGAGYPNHE